MEAVQTGDTLKPTALARHLAQQPRGARQRLARKTGLALPTIDRAIRGLPVEEKTATLISRATRGRVAKRDILQVKGGKERFDAEDDAPDGNESDDPEKEDEQQQQDNERVTRSAVA